MWCVASEEDELEATAEVLQRQQELPHAEMHVVTTLLQAHWCEPGANCRAVNQGDKYTPLLRAAVNGWNSSTMIWISMCHSNRRRTPSTELFPDNARGGKEIGHEFYRVAHSIASATIALLA